jgi:hypothetical protein
MKRHAPWLAGAGTIATATSMSFQAAAFSAFFHARQRMACCLLSVDMAWPELALDACDRRR